MKHPTRPMLRKGKDLFEVIDHIEGAAVAYMAGKRGLGEQAMRNLIDSDAEVRASWQRKIARGLKATGLDTTKLIGR